MRETLLQRHWRIERAREVWTERGLDPDDVVRSYFVDAQGIIRLCDKPRWRWTWAALARQDERAATLPVLSASPTGRAGRARSPQ